MLEDLIRLSHWPSGFLRARHYAHRKTRYIAPKTWLASQALPRRNREVVPRATRRESDNGDGDARLPPPHRLGWRIRILRAKSNVEVLGDCIGAMDVAAAPHNLVTGDGRYNFPGEIVSPGPLADRVGRRDPRT